MKHSKTLLSIASILAIAIFVAACGSENTPQTTSGIITGGGNSQEAVLQDIFPDPSRITLTPVSSAQITIVGSYSDGTRGDITSDIDWSPYNGNLAYAIDNNGFLTAYSSGVFDLQITHLGLTNEITIDIIGVTEDPFPEDPLPSDLSLTGITIEDNTLEISIGESSQISVIGMYTNGSSKNVTADIAWSDYNTSSSYFIDDNGVLTAYDTASTDITIALGLTSDTLMLNISAGSTDDLGSGSGVSTFVESPIIIDGQITSEKWGLAPTIVSGDNFSDQRGIQSKTYSNDYIVFIRNDTRNLYLFLDVLTDQTDDDPSCSWYSEGNSWSCNHVDYYSVFTDSDASGSVSPGIDYRYSFCEEFDSFEFESLPPISLRPNGLQIIQYPRPSRINFLSATSSNGCYSGGKTAGQLSKGFGTTYNSSTNHRYYEISIPLNELCISDDGTTFLMVSPGNNDERSRPIKLSNVTGNGCVSAEQQLEIKRGDVCNNFFGDSPQIMSARNNHPTFSILATIKISDRNSGNGTTPSVQEYTIPPNSSVDLGCSADGSTPSSRQSWNYEVIQASWSHEPI